MQTATQTLSYDSWTAGEFGTIAPDLASPGSWTGENVVVYRDGHIGPRPGLKKVPLTGTPTGEIKGIGFVPTVEETQPAVWFIIGDKVYLFRAVGTPLAVTTTTPDLDAPVTDGFVWWKESTRQLFGKTYIVTPGSSGKGYRIGMTDSSLEDIAGMDGDGSGGKDIETYKERLLYVEDGVTSTRIWYSGPADFDDWPVENYFDVGASWPVGQIMEFQDGLSIFTNSGIWLLTGTLPFATLRRVSEGLPPRMRSIIKTNEDIYYIPATRSAPVAYTGSTADENALKHLEVWKPDVTSDVCGVMVYANRDLLFLSAGSEMLWRKNNSWTRHKFSVDVGPYLVRYFDNFAVLTDGGGSGVAPQFYQLQMSLNRPAFVSDNAASPGDDSTTPLNAWFRIPDYFSDDGKEVRVRSVKVDFTKYDTGAPGTNNITVQVDGLARFRMPGSSGSQAVASWTEDPSDATTGGVRDRAVLNIGQSSFHGGFRLTVKDIRGVKIDRILVDIETLDRRPRS